MRSVECKLYLFICKWSFCLLATLHCLEYFIDSSFSVWRRVGASKGVGILLLTGIEETEPTVLIAEEDTRETYQVRFMAIVREISRLLKQYNKLRQNEDENDSYEEEFDENLQHK